MTLLDSNCSTLNVRLQNLVDFRRSFARALPSRDP